MAALNRFHCMRIYIQVAELASLAQLLPPRSPTVRNPAPDSSLCRLQSCIHFNCCSPFASAAAPRLRLLLAACIRFSCCSRSRPLRLRFIIASASTAAPRLRPLRLLLPNCACWIPAHARTRTFFAEFEFEVK